MIRLCLSVLICVSLLGCVTATTPAPIGRAIQAPAARLLAYQQPLADGAPITVVRDLGILGSGCFKSIYFNGVLAARLDVGEQARFNLPPGELLMKVGRDPQGKGLCGTMASSWTQRETVLVSGVHKTFRISMDVNGKPDIQRAD